MKRKFKLKCSKMTLASSLIVLSGICGFAGVAIADPNSAAPPTEQAAESHSETAQPNTVVEEISNGQPIEISDGVSITPVNGWLIERKSAGMSLVMKEVIQTPSSGAQTDYSKPIFARNISVMSLSKARPMDSNSVDELKNEISKMFSKNPSLNDFTFTDAKFFDYKSKNDGIVLFSQLTVNNYQMMQMQIIVSGDQKTYLLTYSDLAANFANPSTFDAAWNSMTSISVPGVAPKRYQKEIILASTVGGGLLALVIPFFLVRWSSTRKIRRLAEELQHDWDQGSFKTDADYELSEIEYVDATKLSKRTHHRKKSELSKYDSIFRSSANVKSDKNSFESSVDSFSTRHSRFG
jgi:hypothetical protein